jgi:hypothetical protein
LLSELEVCLFFRHFFENGYGSFDVPIAIVLRWRCEAEQAHWGLPGTVNGALGFSPEQAQRSQQPPLVVMLPPSNRTITWREKWSG